MKKRIVMVDGARDCLVRRQAELPERCDAAAEKNEGGRRKRPRERNRRFGESASATCLNKTAITQSRSYPSYINCVLAPLPPPHSGLKVTQIFFFFLLGSGNSVFWVVRVAAWLLCQPAWRSGFGRWLLRRENYNFKTSSGRFSWFCQLLSLKS